MSALVRLDACWFVRFPKRERGVFVRIEVKMMERDETVRFLFFSFESISEVELGMACTRAHFFNSINKTKQFLKQMVYYLTERRAGFVIYSAVLFFRLLV